MKTYSLINIYTRTHNYKEKAKAKKANIYTIMYVYKIIIKKK